MKKKFFFLLFFFLFFYPLVANATIVVVDGDTIKINGLSAKLHGIDAPELKQLCHIKHQAYECGKESKSALEALITKETQCMIKGRGFYGRAINICYNDQKDINAEMVKNGMAIAYTQYSKDYITEEKEARLKKRGIWRGIFVHPAEYRNMKKVSNKDTATEKYVDLNAKTRYQNDKLGSSVSENNAQKKSDSKNPPLKTLGEKTIRDKNYIIWGFVRWLISVVVCFLVMIILTYVTNPSVYRGNYMKLIIQTLRFAIMWSILMPITNYFFGI